MNLSATGCTFALLLVAATAAEGADNIGIERLATCQDSWVDWKSNNPDQLKRFADRFQSAFMRSATDPSFVPRSSQTVAGLPLAQVFPESVGMGVGFSVVVNATFETTKANLQRKLSKSFACERPSDNMRTCGIKLGEKKTIVLMAEDNPKSTKTLFGCYYFYEK